MKNIVLRDEVYKELESLKKDKESFSDVVSRILKKEKDNSYILDKYSGSLKTSKLFNIVLDDRKSFKVRNFDF